MDAFWAPACGSSSNDLVTRNGVTDEMQTESGAAVAAVRLGRVGLSAHQHRRQAPRSSLAVGQGGSRLCRGTQG
jgi:hypothetical protein